jgi:hypothetical protein
MHSPVKALGETSTGKRANGEKLCTPAFDTLLTNAAEPRAIMQDSINAMTIVTIKRRTSSRDI